NRRSFLAVSGLAMAGVLAAACSAPAPTAAPTKPAEPAKPAGAEPTKPASAPAAATKPATGASAATATSAPAGSAVATKPAAGATTAPAGAAPAKAGGPVVIRWWDHYLPIAPLHKQIWEQFSKENPGVTVEYTQYNPPDLGKSLQLAVKSGQMPDVFAIAGVGVP